MPSIIFVTLTDTTTIARPTGFSTVVSTKLVSTNTLAPPTTRSTFTDATSITTHSGRASMTTLVPPDITLPPPNLPTTPGTSIVKQQVSDAVLILLVTSFVLMALMALIGMLFLCYKNHQGYCPGCKERDTRIKFLERGDPLVPKGAEDIDLNSLIGDNDERWPKASLESAPTGRPPSGVPSSHHHTSDPEFERTSRDLFTSFRKGRGRAREPDIEMGNVAIGNDDSIVDFGVHPSSRPNLSNPYASDTAGNYNGTGDYNYPYVEDAKERKIRNQPLNVHFPYGTNPYLWSGLPPENVQPHLQQSQRIPSPTGRREYNKSQGPGPARFKAAERIRER